MQLSMQIRCAMESEANTLFGRGAPMNVYECGSGVVGASDHAGWSGTKKQEPC